MNKTVTLRDPFPGHGGEVTSVEMRPPTGAEFLTKGDPRNYGRTPGGILMMINDGAIVRSYLETCIVKPDPLLAIAKLSLRDGMAVQQALFDFFDEAQPPSVPS